jgi:hypothetical protein
MPEHFNAVASVYDSLCQFFGVGTWLYFTYKRVGKDHALGWPQDRIPYLVLAIGLYPPWFLATQVLSYAVVYVGLPTILTFGIKIGGVLPTSCEASIPYEGIEGLPCSTKRFLHCLLWKIGRADGGSHVCQLEEAWFTRGFVVVFCVLWVPVWYGFVHWSLYQHKKAIRKARSYEHKHDGIEAQESVLQQQNQPDIELQ